MAGFLGKGDNSMTIAVPDPFLSTQRGCVPRLANHCVYTICMAGFLGKGDNSMMHVDQTPSKGVCTETSRAEGYCVQVIIGLVCKDTE